MRCELPRRPKSSMVLKPLILRTGKPHLHFGERFSCEKLVWFLLSCVLNVALRQRLKPAQCTCPGIKNEHD
ncbi:uncharacterized protein PpBr36_10970 [Pyricularia pennisetigena]|uniref:uncharacterized protein n=1 Tax=Pyricularia pennisetigena TaxID=1578925 RepID=UPI00114E0C3B|nr:uncharacterized protein PpBr36_10970 [Pyricularia pennisetigena]TLS20667.1 hypothetical protein PpBr36_10970 [Pyricularia pennisetigena]